MNLQIDPIPNCNQPLLIEKHFFYDPYKIYNTQTLALLWLFFRLRNPIAKKLYSYINRYEQFETRLTHQFIRDFYRDFREFWEPLFLKFINGNYTRMDIYPTQPDQYAYIIIKQHHFIDSLRAELSDDFFEYISDEGFRPNTYIIALIDCV